MADRVAVMPLKASFTGTGNASWDTDTSWLVCLVLVLLPLLLLLSCCTVGAEAAEPGKVDNGRLAIEPKVCRYLLQRRPKPAPSPSLSPSQVARF